MKSAVEQLFFSSRRYIILIGISFLQACLAQKPTLSPDQVRETAMAAPFCGLAESWDHLLINFTGETPNNFLVRVEDGSGNVGAIQCFEDKQATSGSPFSTAEVETTNAIPLVLGLCDSNNGYFKVNKWPDGTIESIIVQCFESKSDNFLNISSCWQEKNAVSFASFSPDELEISIFWNGGNKTEIVKPVYESFYPNGQGCEPEYLKSEIDIELP